MKARIIQFLRDEEGATAIEYGIIAGLMALMLVTIFGTDGVIQETLSDIFTNVKNIATGAGE
ncbi:MULTISPECIES: Flp family type IVb pilin [Hydrogenophaga]|uniref:Flp/Fap pilin component n=1 Tax=Hydrogenophaga electricum TaxID=1230953 RepID=A0ABQ6C442_9BURK|nr:MULTISPECIES: Flp family type IVb pilin [Hydrogenophaga]GLS14509.1 Flp/Fap pilin component [Hydrogenophaga electricum]